MTAWATNPQAAQIDALIERAALLTPDEIHKLAEAADAAWDAHRLAARARFAVRSAVRAWFVVRAWFAAADQEAVADRFAARQVARRVAQDADRHADWYAARAAAVDRVEAAVADRFAARRAARRAARSAVRAWFVAQDASAAAEALVVRDLIDEATEWNQEAYDLLTGPWRRVIGPIHPDDEVLR